MIRKNLSAVALAACLFAPSCLGPDHAYTSVRDWNARAIKPDWLAELTFIGFHVVPVYQFCLVGDYLIFNTIDYWSGENPIEAPGEFPDESFGKDD